MYNAVGRMQGWQEIPLSDHGNAQASALGRRLADVQLDHIYSSDLRRTTMTACIVAAHTGTPISYDALYRERNPGDLTDEPHELCIPFFEDPGYAPPNGESVPVFRERVREAFDGLIALEGDSDRHVAVVTHGMVCSNFVQVFLGFNLREDPKFHWANTSLTVCDYRDGVWEHSLLACAEHLEGLDSAAEDRVGG